MRRGRLRAHLLVAAGALGGWSAASAQYTTLHAFSGEAGEPHAKMLHSQDQRLYGTTAKGCVDGVGSVFAMVPNGAGGYGYALVGCFARTDGGHTPLGGVIEGADGALYGTASAGGPDGAGAVFRMTKTGQLSFLHVFNGTDGREPHGELVLATDGALYGTTAFGGPNDYGTVFRVETDGTFASLHSFDGQHGQQPMAGLAQASNGDLYGTTYLSTDTGTGGVVYRISTAGDFAVLQTFTYPYWYPRGPLAQLSDGMLYGTTWSTAFRIGTDGSGFEHISYQVPTGTAGLEEGVDGFLYGTGEGIVFRLSPNNFNFQGIHTFSGLVGMPSTLIEMSDYGFIGTCPGSGDYGDGFVFRVYPWQQYEELHRFPVGRDGRKPVGALAQGDDGALWGTTERGGDGFGTIFQVGTRGGHRVLRRLDTGDGYLPIGGLVASFGAYFGVTTFGGAAGSGTAFRIDAGGAFQVVQDFDEVTGKPASALRPSSSSTFLGITSEPGPEHYGGLYRLNAGGGIDPLYDFTGYDGPTGHGRPLEASDGAFIGNSSLGGPYSYGSIFRWDSLNGFLSLHNFTGLPPEGFKPEAGLIEPTPGSFFGTTYWGGASGIGTVYAMDAVGEVAVLHDFAQDDGGLPLFELIAAPDGKMYGTTTAHGANGLGTIFRIDSQGVFERLHDFSSDEGGMAWGPLIRGRDGAFYGSLSEGGPHGAGAIFRFASADLLSIGAVEPDSGDAFGGAPVVITGTAFDPAAEVSFAGVPAGGSVDDPQHISLTSPSAQPGSVVWISISNPGGESVRLEDGWFADFLDVPDSHPFHDFIESIVRAGVTAGCGGGNYCAAAPVTRAQMAVFLLKAEHGPSYIPPACAGMFGDVGCPSAFADWIERLAGEGVTGGCGGGNYCPASTVTRAQMAVFLLKTLLGSSYVPPPAAGIFGDVPVGAFAADWIEDLYGRQITGGCSTSPLLYCPNNANTRGQMAVFLTKTFGLP